MGNYYYSQQSNGGGRGGYQQSNRYSYGRSSNYGEREQTLPPPQPKQEIEPPTPEEFIEMRLRVYDSFIDHIKSKGKDPADFAFFLGGWVTSYLMDLKSIERENSRR